MMQRPNIVLRRDLAVARHLPVPHEEDIRDFEHETEEAAPVEAKEPSFADRFRDIPPCYAGHVKMLRWGHTSASGMTASFELLDVNQDESHPFKGLRAAKGTKTEGQRMQVAMRYAEDHPEAGGEQVYTGECLLIWWAEDCAEGMKLTIRFDETVDGANFIHPCEGMETGRRAGEVLTMVVWALDDDDQVADPSPRKKRGFSSLTATAQTNILCRDVRFFNWLASNEATYLPDQAMRAELHPLKDRNQELYCEHVVKLWCGIQSRAEFNRSGEVSDRAHAQWHQMLQAYEERNWKK